MKPEYSNKNSAERQPQILRLRPPRRTPLRMTDQLFREFQTQDARSC
jgi:hypothetical protein